MNNKNTHFLYWILPTLVTLACILLYFFDVAGSSSVISPSFNREFGVLENLQLLLILVVFFIALKAIKRKDNRYEKYMFGAIAVLAIFFLLEEIDYGLHYYELFTGEKTTGPVRNVHNNGKITSWFKMGAYIFLALFFVVFPFTAKYTKERLPFLYYISPSKKIIATLVSLILLNQLAFYFYNQDVHINRSLDGNVSEFEELMIYYIVVLYIMELADSLKKFPGLFGIGKEQLD